MKFKQFEDGSCDIEFNDQEIEYISKNKKLHLTSVFFKHFSNYLFKIIVDWQEKFPEKVKTLATEEEQEINSDT
tara:strand:+ start:3354 stop:3575 length:222 start_codon:yes stop_codon:yes gene_type:complete